MHNIPIGSNFMFTFFFFKIPLSFHCLKMTVLLCVCA
jgi:hypothetical protein